MNTLARILRVDDIYTDHNGGYWRVLNTADCISEDGELVTTVEVKGQSLRHPTASMAHQVNHDVVNIYHKQ